MRITVSVIIVGVRITPYMEACIEACLRNQYADLEVIVVTDSAVRLKLPKLRTFGAGALGPAAKRDFGAARARGDILAFIDDDAYPDSRWLTAAARHFSDKAVAGVGGPGVTPKGVDWKEAASGWVSASPVGSGGFGYRFLPGTPRDVDDYPSMNLSVRKSDFVAAGGFDSTYWPGEDTKLCYDLVYRLGKRIVYDPEVLVYHHRRPLWAPHLRQNGNFGLHRGYFARILPKTSARVVYAAPSAMVLTVIVAVLAPWIGTVWGLPQVTAVSAFARVLLMLYAIILGVNALWILKKSGSIFMALISVPAIFITHAWYGIRFIQGFLFTATLIV